MIEQYTPRYLDMKNVKNAVCVLHMLMRMSSCDSFKVSSSVT